MNSLGENRRRALGHPEETMHDLFTMAGFLTMLMAPCMVAMHTGLYQGAEGYMREEAELEEMELRHIPGGRQD